MKIGKIFVLGGSKIVCSRYEKSLNSLVKKVAGIATHCIHQKAPKRVWAHMADYAFHFSEDQFSNHPHAIQGSN